uniref:Internal virion protein n=1 Tax=Rousettus bat poxvirus TaxID=3141933 RepID=A0AAU7E2M8_9POXV
MNKNNAGNDPQRGHTNYVESRLCSYERDKNAFSLLACTHRASPKYADDEEANCWVELSTLVYAARAAGFPLVYGVRAHSSGARTVYFEDFRNLRRRRFTDDLTCVSMITLFQIAAVLYTLYRRGIFADSFEFELVTIPRTAISFAVNQVVFSFSTDLLVVLSQNSRLYRAQLPQSCYLAYLTARPWMRQRNIVASDYFFEWFIRNHFDLLSKQYLDLFRTKKKYITTPNVHRMTEPGTLVYVIRDDMQVLGVTLTDVSINDNVRVIYSSDGGTVFEVDDFLYTNVFVAGEMLTRARLASFIL